ncbi:Phosphoribosylaminoimidazole-succinocarboxamide synthase [Tetrabaena socialis]|uniref:phosphoribosylaminoimidazolesuccinocarboxamide synthase n=1 Tax=Tetrabaena socialis TaxID=47790 RepID=A0A2J7ZN10_9CHLO|nr:Phosphoribosylaminoimidazole-succinocarboxamide synthase [Tetrabaena socialis]|eukprot:PNH01647.1 Phosphoribosylaminoimidazole-succinocarboxamide synthase [Tetrabaena socialis]
MGIGCVVTIAMLELLCGFQQRTVRTVRRKYQTMRSLAGRTAPCRSAAPLRHAAARRARASSLVVRAQVPTAAPPAPTVESISGVRAEVVEAIAAARLNCLTATDLPLPNRRQGKVRDTYDLGDKVVIVTTDRQSAFDRLLACVPFKGQVLNQTAAWWFDNTAHIVPSALLSTPDPNVSVMKKCKVFPVEFVCRGYMTAPGN